MRISRPRSALICLAVALALVALFAPSGRAFAGKLASRIARFHPSPRATLQTTAPIPFILDHKHNRKKQ